MSWEAWLTLAVVVVTVVVLARDLVPPAMTVLTATVVLLVSGVLTPSQAFGGFSNPAPITVAALFVLARAVEVTGLLDPLVGRVLGSAGPGDADRRGLRRMARWQLARLVAPVAAASAMLNNTTMVAMLAPQLASWTRNRGQSPTPLLMPLSFAAILGGTLTAIGTSTNLVVSGLLQRSGAAPLGLFEITWVGLPLAAAGAVAIILLAPLVLPDRRGASQTFEESVREFSVAMSVVAGGALDGRTVEDAGLRHLQGVYLVQIERDGQAIAPVAPDQHLHGHDVLTFVGKADQVVDLQRTRGLVSTENHHFEEVKQTRQTFYEAVLGPESWLVGRTLKEVGFRGYYGAAVVAIHRAGERVDAKLGEVILRAGDTLLLVADEAFSQRWRDSRDFLLVAGLDGAPPARTSKAPWVAGVLAGLVAVAGLGLMPILNAALVAALALVAVGALSVREARQAVNLHVVVLIAAAFGLGSAVATTGLADRVAGLLVGGLEPLGALGALAGVMVATVVLTEVVTNNAAAVLMFPIAVSTANQLGAEPRGFVIGIAVAASASFLTPIGYQTNTMVYGLGGYRYLDYPRLGGALTVLVFAVSLAVIPRVWGL